MDIAHVILASAILILAAWVSYALRSHRAQESPYAPATEKPATEAAEKFQTETDTETNLNHETTSPAEAPAQQPEIDTEFMNRLNEVIARNLSDADFGVHQLASELNMSISTLYRNVKKNSLHNAILLIRHARMEKAGILLRTPSKMTIQEVAEAVGYNDLPTFRKHFIRTFSYTPSAYAAKYKAEREHPSPVNN